MFKKLKGNWLRAFTLAFIMAFVMIGIYEIAMATTALTTTTGTRSSLRGINWMSFRFTFVNAADTTNMPVTPSSFPLHDPILFNLVVSTQRPGGAANNPISIGVRWESSLDNQNWISRTIGTDSTSWFNLATDTVGNSITSPLQNLGQEKSVHQVALQDSLGWFPYQRVKVFGKSTNTIGEKVFVDVIEQ